MEHIFKFKNLTDLEKALGTEKECRAQYESLRWDGCPVCPNCGGDKTYIIKASEYNNNYKCANNKCYRRFNCITGTVFENTKLPLVLWMKALYLLASTKRGVSSPELASKLGVTQRTAWFVLQRLREKAREKEQPVLQGEVLADETFVGGKNINRHKDKKVKKGESRVFEDKVPIIGIMQNEESYTIKRPHEIIKGKMVEEKIITSRAFLYTKVVAGVSAQSLQPIVKSVVAEGSTFITDEWGGYNNLGGLYNHRVIDHGRKQYVAENGDTTNRLEGAWKQLKMKIRGTHNHVGRKHLQRYSDEFAFHYNYRHLNPQERFMHILNTQPTRLKYKDLIGKGKEGV